MDVLVLASETLSRKKLPAFKDRSTVLVNTPVVDCGEVWERGLRIRRVLGGEGLVHNVDVFEGCHTSSSGAVVSQVHFLFGIHLVSFLPISYQCTEAVDPFQGYNARIGLESRKDHRSLLSVGDKTHLEPHNMTGDHK